MSGRAGARKKTAVFAGAVLLCALAGEMGIRLLAPFPDYTAVSIRSFPDRYHPLYGYMGIPNLDRTFTLPDFSHRILNNRRGFRDRDRPYERGAKRRIAVVGDSTAWGWGVEAGERFSDIMERRLEGWEVVNLAQAGYSTDQELLLLECEGLAYHPEIVLLLFDRNDVAEGNNARVIDGVQPKPWYEERDGALEVRGVPVPFDPAYWDLKASLAETYGGPAPRGGWRRFWRAALAHSHLFNWISFRVEHPSWGRAREGDGHAGEALLEKRFLLTGKLLARMNRLCSKRGARLVIADVPSEYSPVLERFCRGNKIPYLDLRPVLAGRLRPVGHRRVGHWNRYGHRLVAAAAVDFLKKNGLLDAG